MGEHIIGLAGEQGIDLAGQANQIASVPEGAETIRQRRLTAARIGQGKFRKNLFERWDGSCAILGVSRPELLRASHIKPWTSSNNFERLDSANRLLLSAMYDAAFDALLLPFADEGALVLASDFSASDAAAAGIDPAVRIEITDPQTRSYLAAHRAMMVARATRSRRLPGLTNVHTNAISAHE